jgi:acetyl-CoA acetyltransferase
MSLTAWGDVGESCRLAHSFQAPAVHAIIERMTMGYVIDAVRTPRGRGKAGKGALSGIHPQELLGQVLERLRRRGGFDPGEVDDVIAGCVTQVGEQGANVARNAVLAAGWPDRVSGVSLNRFCASGLQAVHFAAMGVASGAMQLAVGGGVESMSRVPMGSAGDGQDAGNLRLRRRVFQVPQGISADLIATLEGFTRQELDAFALRSQHKAARAITEGRFAKSLCAVRDASKDAVVLERDEYPRPDTTAEGLAALGPAFVAWGVSPPARMARPSTSSRWRRTPRPTRWRTCTPPAIPAAWWTGRRRCCSHPTVSCGNADSSRARKSGRWPRSAASRC